MSLSAHNLHLALEVKSFLTDLKHIHCMLIEFTFFLDQHELVVLALLVFVHDFLGSKELVLEITVEHFTLALLLSLKVLCFIALFLPLKILVIHCLLCLFLLLFHFRLEHLLLTHKAFVLCILKLVLSLSKFLQAFLHSLVLELRRNPLLQVQLTGLFLSLYQLCVAYRQCRLD